MEVKANIQVLAKMLKPWSDANNIEHIAYKANIAQNNFAIVESIRLSQEQYQKIEAGKSYILTAEYGTGKNGGYLRILDFTENK